MEFAYATDENTYAWSNAAGRGHQQQRSTGARKSRGGSSAHGLSPAPPNPFGLSPIASVSGMAALLDDVSIDGMGATPSPAPKRCAAAVDAAVAPAVEAAPAAFSPPPPSSSASAPMSSDDIMASLMAEAMLMIETQPTQEAAAKPSPPPLPQQQRNSAPAPARSGRAVNDTIESILDQSSFVITSPPPEYQPPASSSSGPSTAMLIARSRAMSEMQPAAPLPPRAPAAAKSPTTLIGVFDEAFDESSLDGATMFVDATEGGEGGEDGELLSCSSAHPLTLALAPPSPIAAHAAQPSGAGESALRAQLDAMREENSRLKARCTEADEANWKLTDEWQVELAKNGALQQHIDALERGAGVAGPPKTPLSRLARPDSRDSPRVNDLETQLNSARQKCNALQSSLSDARAQMSSLRERCATLEGSAARSAEELEAARSQERGGTEALTQQLLATRETAEELQSELQCALVEKQALGEKLHAVQTTLTSERARAGGESAKHASKELAQLRRECDAARARCEALELESAKTSREAASRRVAEQAKQAEFEKERARREALESEKDAFAKTRKEIVRVYLSSPCCFILLLSSS